MKLFGFWVDNSAVEATDVIETTESVVLAEVAKVAQVIETS